MRRTSFGRLAVHRHWIVTLLLGGSGLALILAASAFHTTWMKIAVDHVVAEVGALLLIVGILHWVFELFLRDEMLRDVSQTVVGSTMLRDAGLETCEVDSRMVADPEDWLHARHLILGVQYSPRFVKDHHDLLRDRCKLRRKTTISVISPSGLAAQYLTQSKSGFADIPACIQEIENLVAGVDIGAKKYIRILRHDRVLRYSFIQADGRVWMKMFANSAARTKVPALKIREGSPLFGFVEGDINRLLGASSELA